MPRSEVSNLSAGRIALGYAFIALLWIAFSDAVVTYFKLHPNVMTIKGTVFVLVTASLLYFTIRRLVRAVQVTSQERDRTAQLYRTVVEASNEGICLLDGSERISFLNGRLAAMLGRSAEEIRGNRLQDFIEEPQVLVQRSAQQSETYQCRLRKDSDHKPWVLISRHPVLNDAGEAIQLVCTAIDITELKRTEDELRRSEAYLAEAQRLSHTGSWYLDVAQNRLSWSDEVFRIFGIQFGTPLSYETFLAAVHPDDRDFVSQTWKKALLGEPYDIEHRILAGREVRWVREKAQLEFDAGGRATKGFGTVQDITERKRAEESLRERADLLNLTHDAVFVMDMNGVIKYWNRGAEEQYGWNGEQSVGNVVHDMLHTVFPSPLEEIKAEVARTGRWDGALLHTRKDGTQLVVASRWALRRDEQGAPLAILETNNDITERKRTEEALRQSEAYLTEAQRLSHTGSWALDVASGKVVYASEEWRRMHEADSLETLPTSEATLRLIHPEDKDRLLASIEDSIREKVDTSIEFRLVLPSGTLKYAKAVMHPLLNHAGDVVQLVGTTIDITERKRSEEERERLRELETELAHINRVSMMGELAASLAHEVNQPLSGIVSNGSACLQWLAENRPNLEEVREALRDLVRDGKRAGEIIARVRALTKRAAMPSESVALNETIQEVLALVADAATKRRVLIGTHFASDLSLVSGDRVQLQQVVLNLVVNALEAMSNVNDRDLELAISTRNIDSDQVQVTVADSGPGLDPNAASRIFDAFYTTKPGGMGMGLSISRSIVQNHGGRLWATPNSGPGASFHFSLPKCQAHEEHAEVLEVQTDLCGGVG